MYDPNHPQWRAFIASIRDNPGDDTPRQVFADFVDEQVGQLPSPYGELIRKGVELARLPDLYWLDGDGEVREWGNSSPVQVRGANALYPITQPLRRAFKQTWGAWGFLDSLRPDDRERWVFRRGMPEIAVAPIRWWYRHGDVVTALAAVDELVLTVGPDVTTVFGESVVRLVLYDDALRQRVREPVVVFERDHWDDIPATDRTRIFRQIEERWVEEAWPGLSSCRITDRP